MSETAFVNRRRVRIEWGDCDPAGIVYYPRYFAMFDDAAHKLLEDAGWNRADLRRKFAFVGIPMVDTRACFLVSSTFGEEIIIESRVVAIRRSSLDIAHRVFRPEPRGEVLAIEVSETRVWAGADPEDSTRMKGQPVPDEVRRKLLGRDG